MNLLDKALLFGIPVVPTLMALVYMARLSGLPSSLAPVLSWVLGVLAGIAVVAVGLNGWPQGIDWIKAVAWGTAYGLSASGLYSGTVKMHVSISRVEENRSAKNAIDTEPTIVPEGSLPPPSDE